MKQQPTDSPHFLQAQQVEVHLSSPVNSVEPATNTICFKDYQHMSYDHLVIATGSTPNSMSPHVITIRSLEDANKFAKSLGRDQRVVLIGGSFIAIELAAYAVSKGAKATVVMRGRVPFEKSLGKESLQYFILTLFANILFIGASVSLPWCQVFKFPPILQIYLCTER